jgi:GTPase Era involved in 16S rRNA processing
LLGRNQLKSHAKLKDELNNAIGNIKLIQQYLKTKSHENIAGVGNDCVQAATTLEDILSNNHLPEEYKVAVVGRFKAGKSSFVNELLEIKLAGEDTSPETAAVTTFLYGKNIQAKINFISKNEWEEQKKLFNLDPKHIDAHRAKMWDSFNKPKKNADGIEEKFDLEEIEKLLISEEANQKIISLGDSSIKNAEKIFRDELKTYTSGSKPYHCLVSSINITTPSSILQGGIELIDTPGLDDTERFRVSLTEQSVQHVDAILFLTKSGVAYGQSEKDFLLTLLRKGTIKQLMIVITQVDQTYQQHIDGAQAEDEEPQSIEQRIAHERYRLSNEIRKTLEELSGSDTELTKVYSEQFSNVEIVFTSVKAHRDQKAKRTPGVFIKKDDPGGLIGFKNQLSNILSTESRIAIAATSILGQSKATLESLADTIDGKLSAIRNTKNREEVERRLNTFRAQFDEIRKGVETELSEVFSLFKESTSNRLNDQKKTIENIVLKAEKELNKFRVDDIARHWRTKRGQNWGYMFDLQTRVANKIFPVVQQMLESHVEDFANYVRRHDAKISKLSKGAVKAASELDLGDFTQFDIKRKLKDSTNKILEKNQELIVTEQEKIIRFLDTFVNEEVEQKISEKRLEVADIWGRGTTAAQQSVVNHFYDLIDELLSDALSSHVAKRNFDFAQSLLKSAEIAPRETFQEIDAQFETALANLRQATETIVNGQREQAEKMLSGITSETSATISNFKKLEELLINGQSNEPSLELLPPDGIVKGLSSNDNVSSLDWSDQLLDSCKHLYVAHRLKDGDSGWPISRLFDPIIFSGANNIRIVDPYLFKPHQFRNLKELILHIVESSKPKIIDIHTSFPQLEFKDANEVALIDLSKELFSTHGVTLQYSYLSNLHDRYVIADSGYVVKLGRGLDIYKPSTGLAAHRSESRKVRACEINIFCVS